MEVPRPRPLRQPAAVVAEVLKDTLHTTANPPEPFEIGIKKGIKLGIQI